MNRNCFWLTEDQFSRLAPLLPSDTRGKPRVDDRRVISGIVHVLKSGGRWIDAPDVYRDDGEVQIDNSTNGRFRIAFQWLIVIAAFNVGTLLKKVKS